MKYGLSTSQGLAKHLCLKHLESSHEFHYLSHVCWIPLIYDPIFKTKIYILFNNWGEIHITILTILKWTIQQHWVHSVSHNYNLYQAPKCFHHPKREPLPIKQLLPISPFSQLLATISRFLSMNLPILNISYNWITQHVWPFVSSWLISLWSNFS